MNGKAIVGIGLLAALAGFTTVKVVKKLRAEAESEEELAKRLGETYHRESDFIRNRQQA